MVTTKNHVTVRFPNCRVRRAVFGVQKWGGAFLARQKWGGAKKKKKIRKKQILTSRMDLPPAGRKVHFFILKKEIPNSDPKWPKVSKWPKMTKIHPLHSTPLHCIPSIHSIALHCIAFHHHTYSTKIHSTPFHSMIATNYVQQNKKTTSNYVQLRPPTSNYVGSQGDHF